MYQKKHRLQYHLNAYEELVWDSDSVDVVEVDSGTVTGVAPGTAIVTASADGKVVAEYTITVVTIPVTSIVLSTNSCEIVEEESFQLSYTLFPENASDYGLTWKSADENVAIIAADGKITAKAPGQTTISISNQEGFIATCSVTVTQKAAYERLSEQDTEMVWIPKAGSKYHRKSSCSNMKNPSQVTKGEAERRGYEPCK